MFVPSESPMAIWWNDSFAYYVQRSNYGRRRCSSEFLYRLWNYSSQHWLLHLGATRSICSFISVAIVHMSLFKITQPKSIMVRNAMTSLSVFYFFSLFTIILVHCSCSMRSTYKRHHKGDTRKTLEFRVFFVKFEQKSE